ncbi:DEKNAAC103996 [Brettanomyces naardenensis]|uniref:DEKNAAC103996 n=1 Tax=Brettanomyces naardenensis TaxID=13370 RepID=A0A448YQD1_BRENA|nr:DEKNAAC103996 [Brettanomyces naardenensis]
MSASSGLSTFRGAGGYWRAYNSIDLATPDAFYSDPGLVWQFYSYRRHKALTAEPNNAHKALARLSHVKNIKFLTISQNVDGLSQRAGHNPDTLLEIHGSLFELRCTDFCCSYVERNNMTDPLTPSLDVTSFDKLESLPSLTSDQLPHCPRCHKGLLRPGVIWFGESLPLQAVDKADEFIVRNGVDLILVIGTSRSVWPAASYVDVVKNQGGKVAIFNTERDEAEADAWQFVGDCSETLPAALEPLFSGSQAA